MVKNVFISPSQLFSSLRYLNVSPEFFGHMKKRLDKKAKVNFKIHNDINSETSNYDTHIAQYFKK